MFANPHTRSLPLTAAALALGLALAGCGDGERPSVEQIQSRIAKAGNGQVTAEQTRCLAQTYYDSDLSDAAVRKLVEAEDISEISRDDLSEDDQAAGKKLYDDLTVCLKR